MIPHALQQIFPAAVRDRGDGYLRQVRLTTTARDSISATVQGATGYLVEVDAIRSALAVACTCPFAAEHGICKHSWAVLRVADEVGSLAPLIAVAGPGAIFSGIAAEEIDDIDEIDDDDDIDEFDDDDFEFDDDFTPDRALPTRSRAKQPIARHAPPEKEPEWKRLLNSTRHRPPRWPPQPTVDEHPPAAWPLSRRIAYFIDLSIDTGESSVAVELAAEKLRRDGTWDSSKPFRASLETWLSAPDPADRQIIQMLIGAADLWGHGGYHTATQTLRTTFLLTSAAFDTVLPLMCSTGRCRVRVVRDERELDVTSWDGTKPWHFALSVTDVDDGTHRLGGVLVRDAERVAFAPPVVAHAAGVFLANGTLARVNFSGAFQLASALHARGAVPLGAHDVPELLDTVFALPDVPEVDFEAGSPVTESRKPPVPCVTMVDSAFDRGPNRGFDVGFLYGTTRIPADVKGTMVFDRTALTIHHRDLLAEGMARKQLVDLGARQQWDYVTRRDRWVVNTGKLVALVSTLASAGWRVDTAGVVHRSFTDSQTSVRSGIDWFDLDASVRYGDDVVSLTALIEAEERGDLGVTLADGSVGLLPTQWLSRLKRIVAGGTAVAGGTRFTRAQTALLDALIEALPQVDVDAAFETARTELRAFDRVAPADPPPSFVGTLRDYQRDGLGWLHFLRQFQLGGCLADDMGLGKTIQVLALLDARRAERATNGPSIVVVPRSLVRNWIREAERFTPQLRVFDHSMPGRTLNLDLDAVDLMITTYGILRRDAPRLHAIQFDYAILDEAQAIKNSNTASAKATRLLRARHRLAVTGTPIENRLEELWSIFEFLNPGMLGAKAGFGRLVNAAREPTAATNGADNSPSAASLMSRALRPVILRRTKQLVAKELPERSEQTLEVEMEPAQRRFYDGILARYRETVLDRVDRLGIGKSRMHILEALLRLRQAACHPVLADRTKASLPSAKLDALVPALVELAQEGHKTLVFSQFTSFLALVRTALDKAELPYEYLDGATRDRQTRVDHFQSDAGCPVFLISLKAGGQGLNLTAADYVYLLDPWWNPAVEAQAIDRTHRIGQTRHVIATRLVARGTIEEKILQLQASKRALADAILSEDQGMLSGIGREELAALLA